jgi:hypothetical protein
MFSGSKSLFLYLYISELLKNLNPLPCACSNGQPASKRSIRTNWIPELKKSHQISSSQISEITSEISSGLACFAQNLDHFLVSKTFKEWRKTSYHSSTLMRLLSTFLDLDPLFSFPESRNFELLLMHRDNLSTLHKTSRNYLGAGPVYVPLKRPEYVTELKKEDRIAVQAGEFLYSKQRIPNNPRSTWT